MTARELHVVWCRMRDLNPQPSAYKAGALPVELIRHGLLAQSSTSAGVGKIKERRRDYKPGIVAFTLLSMLTMVATVAADDDEEQESHVTQSVTARGRALEVSTAIQKQAGIEILRPDLTELRPEDGVQGQVMDLQPFATGRVGQDVCYTAAL